MHVVMYVHNKVIAPVVDQLVGGRNVFNEKIDVNRQKLNFFLLTVNFNIKIDNSKVKN